MDNAALRELVDRLPRVHLTALPTPLEEVPRFARAIAGDRAPRIFIKRDDLTQIVGGGNKARVLEFFIGEALAQDANVLIAGGGVAQSNHARACGAAARKFGMKPVMVLRAGGDHGETTIPQGNLLLDRLLDIELRFVSPEQMKDRGRFGLVPFMEEAAEEYRARGFRPYIIPGSPYAPGPVGYVNAALELDAQLDALGASTDWIFAPSTGGTQAGLMVGAEALGRDWKVVGVSPSTVRDDDAREQVARVAGWTAERLGLSTAIVPEAIRNFGNRYAGDRYGKPTEAGLAALHLLATTEGVVLDPVYNAKAMSGLIDQIRLGAVRPNETVIFVNTGGFPELFAYNAEIAEYCNRVGAAATV
jgi:1-aminocyclopropane-1-carboxylate deaminase/D-cysteine desulfhydrase-like pyridoxal-dependent ACC family enzyme